MTRAPRPFGAGRAPLLLRATLYALPALLLPACGGDAGPEGPPQVELPADWLRPALANGLAEHAGHGLPETGEALVREYLEMLDATGVGGRIGRMALRDLEERDALERASVMLALVESRESSVEIRRAAYGWLAHAPLPAVLPRLVLRLKYEKDWRANVDLADALLQLGNGAGLEALTAILMRAEEDVPGTRQAAADVLTRLPGRAPDADFDADWALLTTVHERWLRERRIGEAAEPAGDALEDIDLRAECWRMVSRFTSQPLRPVDNARYVLTRMRCDVVPLLLEAAHDESLYVREHAMQTLAWIGYPVGRWAQRRGFDYLAALEPALGDTRARMRVLEALGASGDPRAAALAEPWLRAGRRDERTAAADVLLRCAVEDSLPAVRAGLEDPALAPEARFALALLHMELDDAAPQPVAPASLAPGERQRRERWAALRDERP